MDEIQKTEKAAFTVSAPIRATAAVGDLRLHEFRSRVFRNTRFLRIWLPRGYDAVSYTHLDVYKRQVFCELFARPAVEAGLKKFVESEDAQPYLP